MQKGYPKPQSLHTSRLLYPPEGGCVGEQGGRPFPPYRLAPGQLAFLIFCSKEEYRTPRVDRKCPWQELFREIRLKGKSPILTVTKNQNNS